MSQDQQSLFDDVDQNLVNVRVEDFIAMSSLVESGDWVTEQLVGKPRNFVMPIAKIYGYANKTGRKTNTVQGKEIESVWLEGQFGATSLITGEMFKSKMAYLPKKFAELAEAAVLKIDLARDPDAVVEMVLTIGARKTAKGVPYAWTVNTALPEENTRLDRLQALALGQPARRQLTSDGGRIIDADAA